MLAHEWRELEVLCERIADLRLRLTAAQRTKNVGLTDGLQEDIARAQRQRELLVQYISARIGATAVERPRRPVQPEAKRNGGGARPESEPAADPVFEFDIVVCGFQDD